MANFLNPQTARSPRAASPASMVKDARKPRKLILCFDGTGNKFHGNDSDSNILKIFRMLDRDAGDQFHYYQRPSHHRFSSHPGLLLILTRDFCSWHRHLHHLRLAVAHGAAQPHQLMVQKGQGLGHRVVV